MLSRTRSRWLLALAAVPATVLAGLTGCGGDREGQRPDPAGVVRVAIREPAGLVPTEAGGAGGGQVLAALFTPLVGFDPDGRPVPVAAESIEPDQDHRVWTVTLRDGYTFHNGEPVTAASYLRAWNYGAYQPNWQRNNYYFERIEGYPELNPRYGGRPAARTLSGLAERDRRTFTVTLAEPFAEFPAMLGAPAFYPLPAAAFTAGGRLRAGFATAPVGNGPFRFRQWRPGDQISVERYPDHPDSPPAANGIEFVAYQDPAPAYADLQADHLDVLTELPPGKLATVRAELGDRYRQVPGAGFQFLAFPAYQRELADPRLRQAISMAIDRDELVAGIFRGSQTAARGFVPPVVPGAEAGGCGAACRFDPAAARDRYTEAGGPDRLTITYNADGGHRDWVEAACDQLRGNLGVACQGQPVPRFTDLLSRLEEQRPVGLVRLGWEMDYPSVASYLDPVFASDGSANLHGYHNPELDSLLRAAAASAEAAPDAYQQAAEILARDLPVIPIRFDQHHVCHSRLVRNVTVTPTGVIDPTTVEPHRPR
jgi:peptide/nickel transport system substrate-binding protein/oligopeptide transport system substrate-binding protein